LKEFLKASYRGGVRIISYGLPSIVLFHSSLLLRRFGLGLKHVSAPAAVQRVTDFFLYNLRYMRPGLVRADLRGDKFLIQLNDPCQYDLVLGIHEPEVVESIVSSLKEGMTFLDVGTNVGYYTLLGARCVGTSGKVVALEPDPEVLAVLRRNIETNMLENVQVVHGAASGTCGRAKLGRARSSSYSTGLYCEDAATWIEVPRYSLDAVVSELEIGAIDLVKLDVEGAELEVIEGMSTILRVNRPMVIMELHGHPDGVKAHPAIQKLKHAGYNVRHISRNHVVGEPILNQSENVE
jgi:FkbM family methyltransferase